MDGSPNAQEQATEVAQLFFEFGKQKEYMESLILNIGRTNMLIGYDWLRKHNPVIDWERNEVQMKPVKELPFKPHEENKRSDYLQPYQELFEKQNFDKLPDRRKWDHEIVLTDKALAEILVKVYPMTDVEKEELDKVLDEALASGRIRPSKSPYTSPVFFIRKKDGSRRLVHDYRTVNEYTWKDKYPLSCILELLDVLKSTKYFNKMDIIWGYNNVFFFFLNHQPLEVLQGTYILRSYIIHVVVHSNPTKRNKKPIAHLFLVQS